MCTCPSSNTVTRSNNSCTSISRVRESTASCGGVGLVGDTEMRYLTGGGSEQTLETLEKLDDNSRRGYSCCGSVQLLWLAIAESG